MILLYILAGLLGIALLGVLFLAVCALLVDPKKEYDAHSPFYRALLNFCTAAAIRIMRIRVHVTGMEKIPAEGRLVFVCNHRSNFDPIITWYALKKWQIAFVSKAENFKIPIFGRFIRKCCFMAIDRENPRNAIRTINKAAELIRADQVSIGVYPEGTRSKSGELLPFHNGVFKIAQKAQVPVVVLSVTGTEKVHKNYPCHPSDVYLNVLGVLEAEDIHGRKTDEIGMTVREMIQNQIERGE